MTIPSSFDIIPQRYEEVKNEMLAPVLIQDTSNSNWYDGIVNVAILLVLLFIVYIVLRIVFASTGLVLGIGGL